MAYSGNFLNLDSDHNGLLSRKELDKYNGGNLNPVFLDRIFQGTINPPSNPTQYLTNHTYIELMTYSGEMDYRTFLDFVLALENIHSPSSISFLFKVLDVHSCGVLSEFCVHYFLKGMMGKLQLIGHELHPIDDVINEIFDIAARGQSREINLDGKSALLLTSGFSHCASCCVHSTNMGLFLRTAEVRARRSNCQYAH